MPIVTGTAGRAEFGPCYAEFTGEELVCGNAHIERRWSARNGILYATSFRDKIAGREWLRAPADHPAPYPETPVPDEPRTVAFSAENGTLRPTQEPSLRLELRAEGPALALVTTFQIFAGARGVTMALRTERRAPVEAPAPEAAAAQGAEPTGIEGAAGPAPALDVPALDSLEHLELAPQHLRLTQVILRDQTDRHNELVFEPEWLLQTNEASIPLEGILFAVEDTLTRDGLLFLKHAPLPHARPASSSPDLIASGRGSRVHLRGHGAGPDGGEGYRWVTLAYTGGKWGRIEALQAYQRQLRAFVPGRDGLFLSNTWGDRSRDARINEPFMRREVEAGARLGADVIQIDDGWQAGRTSNSATAGGVWEGFWSANPDFWTPHPERFPDGLEPVVAMARERGLQFGLWFAPDSSRDFANWERDAEALLGLHAGLGIGYFKIDGVKMRTKAGEANLRRFFERVLEGSDGRVVFDLDVTAEQRPGYFALVEIGPLFVENRYTDWHGYWPHQTLRNLWKLSHWVDPVRLRMEFLNNTRNTEKYPDDPLAPACYAPEYLFATVMFANPLGWFEMTNLPEPYIAQVGALARVWREHRERLFGGRIYPIGEPPDGTSWTGFASVAQDGQSGYLLLFRELNDRPEWSMELPVFGTATCTCARLAGEGSASLSGGRLHASIPEAQRYLFLSVVPG